MVHAATTDATDTTTVMEEKQLNIIIKNINNNARTVVDIVHSINDNVTTTILNSEEYNTYDDEVSKHNMRKKQQYDGANKDDRSISHDFLNDVKHNDNREDATIAIVAIVIDQPQDLEE